MMVLSLSALISAASSTTEPRAMLIRMPSGPSALSTSALIMFLVSGAARHDRRSRMFDVARHVEELRIVAVAARPPPAGASDRRPAPFMASSRRAIAWPIAPMPTMPTVRLRSVALVSG